MPRVDLAETPGNPAPPGATVFAVETRDGIRLRSARWEPQRPPKGALLLLQGRAEFIEKYFEVVGEALQRGFAVITFDWRGQGGSDRLLANRRKGHVGHFRDYEADLRAVFDQAMAEAPEPRFALAHSMGGAVLLRVLRRHPNLVARAVLTAPMIEIARVTAPRSAGILAEILSLAGLGRGFVPGGGETAVTAKPFERNVVTLDKARHERAADMIAVAPDLGLGDPTIGWVKAAYRAMAPFADPNFPLQVATPILCVAGTADVVTSTPAIERFAARLKTGRVLTLTGAMHEILMERDEVRALFWAAFDAFIPGETDANSPPRSTPQQVESLGVQPGVAGGQDSAAPGGVSSVPGGHQTAGAGNDGDQGDNVIRL